MVRKVFLSFAVSLLFGASAYGLTLHLPYKYPGTLGYFELDSDAPAKVVLGYRGKRWVFKSPRGSREVYFVIPYQVRGNFSLTLYQNGKRLYFQSLPVWKKKYRVSKIWVKSRPLTKELLARIRRENRLLRKIFSEITPKKFTETKLHPPLKKLSISTPFGAKRIINGKKRSIHWGTDFRAPAGTPVYAALSGRVVLAKNLYFTGNTVIIDHGAGIHTLYAHLSKITVKEGQEVKAGQVIGKVGSTGRSTGPHLHFGFYVADVKADPMIVMKEKLK